MRRTRVILLIAILVLIPALSALAWSRNCPVNTNCVINPTGTYSCGPGLEWRLRTYSDGFGFTDSTGNGTMQITSGGYNYYKYRSGEWDGITWTWYTGRTSMTYSQAKILDVSQSGSMTFHVACA
jgi:hypothetical protein